MNGTKDAIRQEMRRRRRSLTRKTALEAGQAVCCLAQSWRPYREARIVLLYASVDNEVPTDAILSIAQADRKRTYLPRISRGQITFAEHRPGEALVPGGFGIPEPVGDVLAVDDEAQAIVLVPMLAWDRSGQRVGRGHGYYDRALASAPASWRRVGLAYSFQECGRIPADPWDAPLDHLMTEKQVIDFSNRMRELPVRKEDATNHGMDLDRRDGGRTGDPGRIAPGVGPTQTT